jgi:4-hydroxybenzoate polyprenyltransferase
MLLLFFLLGVAAHQKITVFSFDYIWVAIALASSYVAATTINDIADRKIDSVNHPSSKDRPLVTGEATEKDLYFVHLLAVAIVLIFAWLVSIKVVLILALSLLINYIYSLPPLKLSYRTHFAPLILSVAYVFIPYWLGTVVAQSTIGTQEWFFIAGLLSLFFGRIILKDFRDRKGDALYGKPTFLLKYGKNATCWLSFISIILGNISLFVGLPTKNLIILFTLELYFVSILFMLYKLSKVSKHDDEQTAIGIGAKMGNGLLLTILGFLVLLEYQAPAQTQILFVVVMTAVFLLNFLVLVRKPEYAVIGYRG